ncbi:MAG: 50S ribosomal protein L29 [Candidatus Eremiobacterota bacterium]
MKSNAYMTKFREATLAELQEELKNAKEELFNLRFQLATQRLSDNSQIDKTRKKIARIHTLIRQSEIAGSKKEA